MAARRAQCTIAAMVGATVRGVCAPSLWAAMAVVLFVGPLAASARAQVGFDRPGADYASVVVRPGDPSLCAARCERDPRCRAWSFSYPETLGPTAVCQLKSAVTHSVPAACCVAGVKGASVALPHVPGMEFAIERPGGDYRSLDSAPSPNACASSCQADAHCRAWTYLRAGYRGPDAHCFLKNHVTRPRVEACCVSGVVR
jgi:PAN domain